MINLLAVMGLMCLAIIPLDQDVILGEQVDWGSSYIFPSSDIKTASFLESSGSI